MSKRRLRHVSDELREGTFDLRGTRAPMNAINFTKHKIILLKLDAIITLDPASAATLSLLVW